MAFDFTGLFRKVDADYDTSRGMSSQNPGGGVSVKIENLIRAVPSIRIITDIKDAGNILLIEPLWFTAGKDDLDIRIDAYAAHNGFKILWTSDFTFTRWKGPEREAILDATDVVAGNSPYMQNILSVYAEDKTAYLTDPFDVRQIDVQPTRERSIYSNAQVIVEKGIDDIIEVFGGLAETDVKRIFIGSVDNWGMLINPDTSQFLDTELTQVCDKRIRHASRSDVYKVAGSAFLALFYAGYETFGYSMIEALAGGCWVFCGKHLAYRDRPVFVCDSPVDALKRIQSYIIDCDLTKINTEGREFVNENYGLDAFRKQLIGIIGREIGI